jgi:hypothetical protein
MVAVVFAIQAVAAISLPIVGATRIGAALAMIERTLDAAYCPLSRRPLPRTRCDTEPDLLKGGRKLPRPAEPPARAARHSLKPAMA